MRTVKHGKVVRCTRRYQANTRQCARQILLQSTKETRLQSSFACPLGTFPTLQTLRPKSTFLLSLLYNLLPSWIRWKTRYRLSRRVRLDQRDVGCVEGTSIRGVLGLLEGTSGSATCVVTKPLVRGFGLESCTPLPANLSPKSTPITIAI